MYALLSIRCRNHLISMLNDPAAQAGGELPSQRSTSNRTPMYDVNGDGRITADDAASLTVTLLDLDATATSNTGGASENVNGAGIRGTISEPEWKMSFLGAKRPSVLD